MGADCKSVAKASQVRILYLPPTSTQAGGCFRACRRGAWFAGTGNLTVLYLAAAAVRLAVAKRDMGGFLHREASFAHPVYPVIGE